MARRLLLIGLLVALATGCGGRKACTAIGCGDQASIRVHRADWKTVAMAVQLDVDGRHVTCAPPSDLPTVGRGCDDPRVYVALVELADCTETRTPAAVSQSCVPNGKIEQVITVTGTPQQIAATFLSDDVVVGQKTFEPVYIIGRPNGPDCEPACQQAAETWQLP